LISRVKSYCLCFFWLFIRARWEFKILNIKMEILRFSWLVVSFWVKAELLHLFLQYLYVIFLSYFFTALPKRKSLLLLLMGCIRIFAKHWTFIEFNPLMSYSKTRFLISWLSLRRNARIYLVAFTTILKAFRIGIFILFIKTLILTNNWQWFFFFC